MEKLVIDWAQLKALIALKGPLYQKADLPGSIYVWFDEGNTKYAAYLVNPSADQEDFDANYRAGADKPLDQWSTEGLWRMSALPSVDPKYACFCQGASKKVSISDPAVAWMVPVGGTAVQIMGMTIWVSGGEKHDSMDFSVGYYVGGTWNAVSTYGFDVPVVVDPMHFHKDSPRVSNPIPPGLTLRALYKFKNPETTNQPDVGILHHLQRQYV